ncbi:MAG: DciA family protein [Synergistaceae bacterium]|jgi:hypothetical protein|nr:DciA family protein [Synergistaceae bacterium]
MRRHDRLVAVEALLPRVMPQYADRAKLDRVAAEWGRVVGDLGRRSAPVDLVNGELLVVAETPLVADRLAMTGGNIARALMEGWKLEIRKVKVIVGRVPLKRAAANERPRAPLVAVREEDVRELQRRCEAKAPDLPDDAAESLARLRAFFAKRFGR